MTSPEFEAALRKYMIDSWEASKREATELGQRTFARAAERAGITQAAPLPLLRRRVRVAPVSTLLQLQRAYCALELVQGVLHGR